MVVVLAASAVMAGVALAAPAVPLPHCRPLCEGSPNRGPRVDAIFVQVRNGSRPLLVSTRTSPASHARPRGVPLQDVHPARARAGHPPSARALPQIALDDALRICLVLRDGDPDQYERAAVRWLGRFVLEARSVTIDELRSAADALDVLPNQPSEAMERLQRLCFAHGIC